jgi:hypothetical protein
MTDMVCLRVKLKDLDILTKGKLHETSTAVKKPFNPAVLLVQTNLNPSYQSAYQGIHAHHHQGWQDFVLQRSSHAMKVELKA